MFSFLKFIFFFYKEKKDYWKIFPIIIMSTIAMINLQLIMSFIFSPSKYFILGLATSFLVLFNILLNERDYNWAIQYSISRKQKITIICILAVDFITVGILSTISRDIYMATH
ncbi:hypothetical protein BXU10_21250 [Flavobacterium sp. LM4]|nr:hypothetical protein BXU10_21250 [Flavobacterium sp. LM4]